MDKIRLLVVIGIMMLMIGCSAAGAGLEARFGYYREDERQQSSAARYEQTQRPWKCFFVPCNSSNVVEGS